MMELELIVQTEANANCEFTLRVDETTPPTGT